MPDLGTGALEDHPVPPVPDDYIHHEVGWVRFVYPRHERARVEPLLESANDLRRRLRDELGHPVLHHLEIRIAPNPRRIAALAPQGLPPPDPSGAAGYPRHRLVLLSLQPADPGSGADLDARYRNVLGKVALFDAVDGQRLPRWFYEGYASHTSGERSFSRARALWSETVFGALLPLSQLDGALASDGSHQVLARAQSADFVRFLMRPQDRDRFRALIEKLAEGDTFNPSLELAYGTPVRSLEQEWREDAGDRYGTLPWLMVGAVVGVLVIAGLGTGWLRRRQRPPRPVRPRASGKSDGASRKQAPTVRVTLTPRSVSESLDLAMLRREKARDVPKVEHDGKWHTLH